MTASEWLPTACVVCSENCGLDATVLPGMLSLPHGFGLRYTTETGERATHGPLINMLTASGSCDPLARTPYHKNVPVRVRKAAVAIV